MTDTHEPGPIEAWVGDNFGPEADKLPGTSMAELGNYPITGESALK